MSGIDLSTQINALVFLFLSGSAEFEQGIGWYTGESYKCVGPSAINNVVVTTGWLGAIELAATAPAEGRVHVRETASRIATATSAGGGAVVDAHVFDARSVQNFRSALQRIDSTQRTPYIVGELTDLLLGFITNPVADFVLGLIPWLVNEQQSPTVSFGSLASFAATGGVLERTLAIYQAPDRKRFALFTNSYRVTVGQEVRTFVLSSCRYAIETVVTEFRTRGGLNDKIVRPNGTQWRKFDVTTNKYDPTILTYVGQDEVFFYFKTESDRQRISFRGGKWQIEQGANVWKTFYAEVDAR